MNQPFINGVQHAWSSIRINFLGRTVTGIYSIEYGNKRNSENFYGAGDEPIGRGQGNQEYENPKLGLYQFETVAIQKAAGGDITMIPPFEIIVEYKETLNSPKVVNIIQNNQFLSNTRKHKQGETTSMIDHELISAGIKWHSI